MSEENNNYENEQQYTQASEPTPVQDEPMYNQDAETVYYTEPVDYTSGKGQKKGMGIASMICGIIALITCCMWCTVIPLGVVSIVLGIIQIVKNESKGMAIAGIVCSAIALILFIVLTVYGNYLESTSAYQNFLNEFMQSYNSGYYGN